MKRAKIEEICSFVTDGKHGNCEDQQDSGFFFLSCKDIRNGKINYDNPRQITENDFKETHKRTNLSPGDILLTNSGTIGRLAVASNHPFTFKTTFQKSVAIIKPKPNQVDSYYLYYYLIYKNSDLVEFAGGTTQKNLLLKDIRSFEVLLPDIKEQKKISSILKLFDDKIELNNQINQTLESMARAIFKEWFIDFGPVKAKAAGKKPFGMDAETAALFPDSFEESELGKIPNGWRVVTLADLCSKVKSGGTPSRSNGSYWINGEIPWLSSGEVRDRFLVSTKEKITVLGKENSNTDFLPKYTTVVAMYGATAGQVSLSGIDLTTNQACCGLTPMEGIEFFNYSLVSLLVNQFLNLANGAAQQNINQQIIKDFKTVVPDEALMKRFNLYTSNNFYMIFKNVEESKSLSQFSDLILPKLISGEISNIKEINQNELYLNENLL